MSDTPSYAVYALTRPGARLALKLTEALSADNQTVLFLPGRLEGQHGPKASYFDSFGNIVNRNFKLFKGHIFICATGAVVRLISPLLASKKEDPAVVVLTQDGRFAVSLLSGHLGGGNELAGKVAALLGAQAVVSTATDLEGVPALEVLARDHDLLIEDFAALPAVSRMLVDGLSVPVYDPNSHLAPLLAEWPDSFTFIQTPPTDGRPCVVVDYRLQPNSDREVLTLRPQAIALGLGCHRGIDPEEMRDFVHDSLSEAGLALKSVACLATVESRAEEPALRLLSQEMSRPLIIFSKDELGRVSTPHPSGKVKQYIGVESVCEAAAMLAARSGSLLINKRKSARATLAAALLGSK